MLKPNEKRPWQRSRYVNSYIKTKLNLKPFILNCLHSLLSNINQHLKLSVMFHSKSESLTNVYFEKKRIWAEINIEKKFFPSMYS